MHRESVQIMKEASNKSKVQYAVYEIVGTFFLCYAFNFSSINSPRFMFLPAVLFVITFISWDLSSTNFNLGVTVAYLFTDTKQFKTKLFRALLTILAQFVGLVLAMFMSYLVLLTTEYGDNGPGTTQRQPKLNPAINTIIPGLGSTLEKQRIFLVEFLSSIIFYTAWIVIRNTKISYLGDEKKIASLFKSFFVALAWGTSRLFFVTIMGPGIVNPTLVIGTWFFDMLVYRGLTWRFSPTADPQNLYKINNLGRWVWLYFMAQIMAAPIAGLIAKNLLEVIELND